MAAGFCPSSVPTRRTPDSSVHRHVSECLRLQLAAIPYDSACLKELGAKPTIKNISSLGRQHMPEEYCHFKSFLHNIHNTIDEMFTYS